MTLIARYPLQEDSGTTVYDVAGSNDGSATGATPDAAGPAFGSAWSFDGTDDSILASISDTPDTITLSAWCRPTSSTQNDWAKVAHLANTTADREPKAYIQITSADEWGGGILSADTSTSRTEDTSGIVFDTVWTHLGLTYDSSTVRFYVDGERAFAVDSTDGIAAVDSVQIGANESNANQYLTGEVADVRLYDHALSDAEIDYLASAYRRGTTTLATKSFSSAQTPNLSADYTLNGSTAVVDVIGSPETQQQEVQQVTLDGSTSFTLNWNSSHTDFRIAVSLGDAASITAAAPTITAITLS